MWRRPHAVVEDGALMTTANAAKPTDVDKALLGSAPYRSLGEQKLSPQEERFEKGRRTVGLFLAPLLTVVFLVLPINILGSSRCWPRCCSASCCRRRRRRMRSYTALASCGSPR